MEISNRWHAVEEAGDDAPENAVTQRSRVHILKIERRHREALHTRCESKLKAIMISKLQPTLWMSVELVK